MVPLYHLVHLRAYPGTQLLSKLLFKSLANSITV